jgi:hypothetical protein
MLHCGGSDACALGVSCLDVLNQQKNAREDSMEKLLPRCVSPDFLRTRYYFPVTSPSKKPATRLIIVKFDRKDLNQQI